MLLRTVLCRILPCHPAGAVQLPSGVEDVQAAGLDDVPELLELHQVTLQQQSSVHGGEEERGNEDESGDASLAVVHCPEQALSLAQQAR